MAKADEEKLVDSIIKHLGQNWFNTGLAAQMIVQQPIYFQDKIMDLMKDIIKMQASRFDRDWEYEQTSAGLMLASHLAEVIEMHEPLPV